MKSYIRKLTIAFAFLPVIQMTVAQTLTNINGNGLASTVTDSAIGVTSRFFRLIEQ